jgi:uncharacterized metal-binding protein
MVGMLQYWGLTDWRVCMIIVKYYQRPMLETNREASNRLNYYAVGLAFCRSLVDVIELRDTYTNEMRSHSRYSFSSLQQCSFN